MFKYNQKIIVPFVIVFLIFGLFYIINEKNLSYNTTIKEQTLPDNINSCNKTKKKINTVPSIKNNNDKIMKYVFENLQINNDDALNDDDNLNLELSEDTDKKLDKELKKRNADIRNYNKLEQAGYLNKRIGLKLQMANLLKNINIQNQKLQKYIPVEHAPVEHAPVEHAPVEHAPVEHAPVEHAPVEHAPVEPCTC